MATLLLVEDTPLAARNVQALLRQVPDLRTIHASDAETAVEYFREHRPDVALVDLYLDPTGANTRIYPVGLRLVADLRRLSQDSVIILYSSEFERDPQRESPQIFESAIAAGADAVLPRPTLLAYHPAQLQQEFNKLRARRQSTLAADRGFVYTDDLRTQAAAESIGVDTLVRLLRQLLPDSKFDRVTALTAGYSGAYVLQVDSTSQRRGHSNLRNVMKVSRAERTLQLELRARPMPGTEGAGQMVVTHAEVIAKADGWHALLMPAVMGHRLLVDYLHAVGRATGAKTLRGMVASLFVQPAKHAERIGPNDPGGPATGFLLSSRFAYAVVASLAEVERCTGLISEADVARAARLRELIESSSREGWNPLSNSRAVAVLHGDMHSRNIFVRDGHPSVVIDLAHRDWYPRLFDFASLEIDVLMNVLDAPGGHHHDVRRVTRWYRLAATGFPYTSRSAAVANDSSRPAVLVAMLRAAVAQELGSVSVEEYGEALVFQLLRFIRFPSVPLAKKVLAVRLGTALLSRMGVL